MIILYKCPVAHRTHGNTKVTCCLCHTVLINHIRLSLYHSITALHHITSLAADIAVEDEKASRVVRSSGGRNLATQAGFFTPSYCRVNFPFQRSQSTIQARTSKQKLQPSYRLVTMRPLTCLQIQPGSHKRECKES